MMRIQTQSLLLAIMAALLLSCSKDPISPADPARTGHATQLGNTAEIVLQNNRVTVSEKIYGFGQLELGQFVVKMCSKLPAEAFYVVKTRWCELVAEFKCR